MFLCVMKLKVQFLSQTGEINKISWKMVKNEQDIGLCNTNVNTNSDFNPNCH